MNNDSFEEVFYQNTCLQRVTFEEMLCKEKQQHRCTLGSEQHLSSTHDVYRRKKSCKDETLKEISMDNGGQEQQSEVELYVKAAKVKMPKFIGKDVRIQQISSGRKDKIPNESRAINDGQRHWSSKTQCGVAY